MPLFRTKVLVYLANNVNPLEIDRASKNAAQAKRSKSKLAVFTQFLN